MDQPITNTNLNELVRKEKVYEKPNAFLEKRREQMQNLIKEGKMVMDKHGNFVPVKTESQKQKYLRDINIRLESDNIMQLRMASDLIDEVMEKITKQNKGGSPDQLVNYSISNIEHIKEE